jgi:ArsR family transcriptional regulator
MQAFPEDKIREATSAVRALAHELRLAILCNLSGGPRSVSELMEATGASQSNLSQHLAKMRMLGLVQCERRKQQMYYSLVHPGFAQIAEVLKSIYCPSECEDSKL